MAGDISGSSGSGFLGATRTFDSSNGQFNFLASIAPSNDAFVFIQLDISTLITQAIGTVLTADITLRDVFDAGYEVNQLFGAKAIPTEVQTNGQLENSTIRQELPNQSVFDGLLVDIPSQASGIFNSSLLTREIVLATVTLTQAGAPVPAPAAVPEPASLGILGMSLLGFAALQRRRKKNG